MLHRLRELQDKDSENRRDMKRPSPRKAPPEPLLPLDEEAVDGGFEEKPFTSDRKGAQSEAAGAETEGKISFSTMEPENEFSFRLSSPHRTSRFSNAAVKTMMKPMSAPTSLTPAASSERGCYVNRKTEREYGRTSRQKLHFSLPEPERNFSELSNSSWSEMSPWVIGNNYHLYPVTPEIEQRLILQYLTPLGEYQEVGLLPVVRLIFTPCRYIHLHQEFCFFLLVFNLVHTSDVRPTFMILKKKKVLKQEKKTD